MLSILEISWDFKFSKNLNLILKKPLLLVKIRQLPGASPPDPQYRAKF
jgi:hypothetical protein